MADQWMDESLPFVIPFHALPVTHRRTGGFRYELIFPTSFSTPGIFRTAAAEDDVACSRNGHNSAWVRVDLEELDQ